MQGLYIYYPVCNIYSYDGHTYKITCVTFIVTVINIPWDFIAPAAFIFTLSCTPLPLP
jgi:hypothetical protein